MNQRSSVSRWRCRRVPNTPSRYGRLPRILPGTLWIETSWGLAQRLPDGRILHIAIHITQGADHVRALLADRDGRIWVGHEAGLFIYRSVQEYALLTLCVSRETETLEWTGRIAHRDSVQTMVCPAA